MACGSVGSKQIKVNPLTMNPTKCYHEEKRKGRFTNLREVTNEYTKEKQSNSVRFVCISDTHNKTAQLSSSLPDGDVLLHAGDFTGVGTQDEIVHFNSFLHKVKSKYKHIVVIAGNHELSFDELTWNKRHGQLNPKQAKELLTNCIYIEEETVELYGINIFGSPWQPTFYDWAFNEDRGEWILKKWEKIPSDTDILITHGPPLGIGDISRQGEYCGCAELLTTVMDRVKPKFHVYGHIHEGYGMWEDGRTTFVNASTCDVRYHPVNKPIVFDYEITP